MKVFTFRYEENPAKKSFARMKKAIATGEPYIRKHEIICDSLDSLFKLMSRPRFELFAAIVGHKPQSLYELAQLVDKDQGNVLRDAKTLEALGLIKFKTAKDGRREKFIPVALYDKIVFEVEPKRLAVND